MKILYLSDILGPHDYRFLRTNVERGYDVTLLTYRDRLDQTGLEAQYYDVRNIDRLKIIHKPELSENTPLNFVKRTSNLRGIVKTERPDILHAGWIQTSGFLAALSRFHPYLLMPWGSDIMYFSKNTIKNRIASRFAIKKADMITVDCEYGKRILIDDFSYPADRVVVMPWDTDTEVFNSDNKDPKLKNQLGLEGKKVVLMMRIFRPEYGIEDFIKSLPAVKAAHPDARYLMLGYGPLENDLKKLASDLGVNDSIVWTGYVPQSEVVKYINISDIYVSTSLRDGSSSSLLEAMACGLPAVVTDIPGNLEWIEDGKNGLVVKRSDPSSIADGINRLIADTDLRRSMSVQNISKIREKGDFRKNFSILEDIYKKLFSGTIREYNRNVYARKWLGSSSARIETDYYDRDHHRDTLELLKTAKGKRVLECGIGTGEFFAAQLARTGKEIYGIDFSEILLNDCRKNLNAESLFTKLVMGDVQDIPFGDEFFDITYAIGVMPYVQDLNKAVSEMFRVTKKDGLILFDIMSSWHISQVLNYWYCLFESTEFGFNTIYLMKRFKKLLGLKTHFKELPERVSYRLISPAEILRILKHSGYRYRIRGYNVLLPLNLPILGKAGNLCDRVPLFSRGLKDNRFMKYFGSKLVVIIEKKSM